MTTNNFKHQTPKHILEMTIGREFTKPKLNAPKFEDATKPMPPFGKLGEILNNSK